jgi:TonB family protein
VIQWSIIIADKGPEIKAVGLGFRPCTGTSAGLRLSKRTEEYTTQSRKRAPAYRAMRPPRKTSKLYLPTSILLHLMILLVFGLWSWGRRQDKVDTWEQQRDDRLVFEVVDVPDHVPEETPDAETHLVSDQDSRAADMVAEPEEDNRQPHSEGDLRLEAYERGGAAADRPDQQRSPQAEKQSEDAGDLAWMRSVDFLEEMKAGPQHETAGRSPGYSEILSSADRRGGISFNTYNWDFAPYMLAMKHKVEEHLFPPYAFTHMGAISGTNVVRFIVLPDGRVRDLVLLASNAHSSLDLTSLKAIEMSLPFLPLPADFPEEYLEVTAHFSYILGR